MRSRQSGRSVNTIHDVAGVIKVVATFRPPNRNFLKTTRGGHSLVGVEGPHRRTPEEIAATVKRVTLQTRI
jgi:hypothetical protein